MSPRPRRERYVSHAQARRIHDLIGPCQDSRLLSEARALDAFADLGAFGEAQAVPEFGCGTGRFAARLLRTRLPDERRPMSPVGGPSTRVLDRAATDDGQRSRAQLGGPDR